MLIPPMPENSGFSPRNQPGPGNNKASLTTPGFGNCTIPSDHGGVLVNAVISGLPQSSAGFFAFHLHEVPAADGLGLPFLTPTIFRTQEPTTIPETSPSPARRGFPAPPAAERRLCPPEFHNRPFPLGAGHRQECGHPYEPRRLQNPALRRSGNKIACGIYFRRIPHPINRFLLP